MFTSYYASQPDDLLSSKIQSLCPTITGNVCCTEAQFDTLRAQVQQVRFVDELYYWYRDLNYKTFIVLG